MARLNLKGLRFGRLVVLREAGTQRYRGAEWPYNGIDRIDNNKGYESGNVIPCCGTCNRAKSNMSLTDFENWIVRVYSQFSSSMWNGAHEKVGYEFRGLSCVEGP